jgi:hypothetical protein
MKTDLDSSSEEELTVLELDLPEDVQLVANMFINEGRRREREDIIESVIAEMYDVLCCCDTSTFGDHYLSPKQADNIIDLIKSRKIG